MTRWRSTRIPYRSRASRRCGWMPSSSTKPRALAFRPHRRLAVDVCNLTQTPDALTVLLKSQDERIRRIEAGNQKSALKSLSENAGLVGLLLGLVLSVIALYDAFVTKPRA